MTYATLSASSSEKTAARQYLSTDQELALIAQVKERTELLKVKKDNFTLDEQLIRIRGERAFNTLFSEYRFLVWHLIKRFSISDRVTLEEMQQHAAIGFDKAINSYKTSTGCHKERLSGWVFFVLRRKFIGIFRSEMNFVKRTKNIEQGLIKTLQASNNETPIKALMQEEIKIKIELAIPESLTDVQSKVFIAHYYNEVPGKVLAAQLGTTNQAIKDKNRWSRISLRKNPRLQELAQEYFS